MLVAVVLLILVMMVVVEKKLGARMVGPTEISISTDQIMIVGTGMCLAWTFLMPLVAQTVDIEWYFVSWVGVGVSLLGLALRIAAMTKLGKSFVLTPGIVREQSLRTDGPYRIIRHPGYAAILCYLVGLSMTACNWLSLVAPAFVAIPLVLRIRVEEGILVKHFGAEYERYQKRTPNQVVPYMW